jgi:hypothetical protein
LEDVMEELTERELDQFEAGFYAAERGDDLPINSEPAFVEGFAFFKLSHAKPAKRRTPCTVH